MTNTVAETLTFDQVHLGVPDPLAAAEWYRHYLGATAGDHVDRVMFGDVRFLFLKNISPQPSHGAAIDHVGLSFADLETTMRALEHSGMRITKLVGRTTGLYKFGEIEDPWGTRIELIEDPEALGFHHVHLRVPDPEVALRWYVEMFGGEAAKLKDQLAGVKYGNVWILADGGTAVPSAGHAVDHIGWRMPDLLTTAIELKGKRLKFTTDPHAGPQAAHAPLLMSFAEDPWGVKIELLQRKREGEAEGPVK
jgi:catechol 2,3-dioxygenase-like lactoylglutathione lyase family enzyme